MMLITQLNTRQQQVEVHSRKKGIKMTNYLKAETGKLCSELMWNQQEVERGILIFSCDLLTLWFNSLPSWGS